jgi:hypothetical protein
MICEMWCLLEDGLENRPPEDTTSALHPGCTGRFSLLRELASTLFVN